jgi:hypothetical protein
MLVLVGVDGGEAGDGPVEGIRLAQVGGDRDPVAAPGMRPGQGRSRRIPSRARIHWRVALCVGPGGARTHDRRIMRSTASCNTRASCTDDTGHRTDDARCTGIIWRAGPRTGPRPRRPCPLVLLLCVTSLRAPSLRPREQARRYGADSSTVRSCLSLHMPSEQRKHHRARFAAATLSAIRVRTNLLHLRGQAVAYASVTPS